jgi:hypothetical protein
MIQLRTTGRGSSAFKLSCSRCQRGRDARQAAKEMRRLAGFDTNGSLMFHSLKYSKIPIWENKRRIKRLERFIEDLNSFYVGMRSTLPWMGQLENERVRWLSTQRTNLTQSVGEVSAIVRLAHISVVGGNQYLGMIDMLDNVTNLDELSIDPSHLADQINQAIGVYRTDQTNSRFRTFWPIFWLARLIEWIAKLPVWLLSLTFGLEAEKTERSWYGRTVTILWNVSLWIFALIQTLGAMGLLGWWTDLERWMTHHR